jgi:hypothetical protein
MSYRTVARRAVFSVELVWAAWVLYRASEGGLSLPAFLGYFYGAGLFTCLLIVSAVAALRARTRRPVGDQAAGVARPLVVQAVILALVVGVVMSNVGFRLRLMLSKSALSADAARVSAGGEPASGSWIGLFYVRETDRAAAAVRFITAACGLDDCGVAFSREMPPRVGEDSYVDLGDGWWHWHRSW